MLRVQGRFYSCIGAGSAALLFCSRGKQPLPRRRHSNTWHAAFTLPLVRAACLQELEGLCCEDVQRYLPAFLSSLHIEALVHGNVLAQGALELGLGVRGALLGAAGAQPLAADARPVDRCLQLPRPCSLLHRCAWHTLPGK